jgi:RimJ/RimL family protein N-acetyltransferase
MYPVTLSGGQITLREFERSDVPDVHRIVGDPNVTDWLSFDARDLDAAASMIDGVIERTAHQPRTEYYLAVCVAHELVGFARLGLSGVQAAKLGYAIRADHWGKGYATDAARTIADFGFRGLKLHRISAAAGPDNAASIAVLDHLGMKYEGRLRDHVYTNGAWRDSLLYSALAHEWPLS